MELDAKSTCLEKSHNTGVWISETHLGQIIAVNNTVYQLYIQCH